MLRNLTAIVFAMFIGLAMLTVTAASQTASSEQNTEAAQTIEQLTSKMSPEEISALTRLLELMSGNEATPAVGASETSTIAAFQAIWTSYTAYFWKNVTAFPEMVGGVGQAFGEIFTGRGFSGSLVFLGMLLVILAVGYGFEFAATRATVTWREKARQANADDLTAMVKALGLRLLLELLGLAVFTIVTINLASLMFAEARDEFIAGKFILLAIVGVRLMETFLRLMLAPYQPSLRIVSADDWTAKFIYRSLVGLAALIGVAVFLFEIMKEYNIAGIPAFRFWVSLLVYVALVYVTWRARNGLTSIIKGQDEFVTTGLERMATWWPWISIIAMAVQYFAVSVALASGKTDYSPAIGITTIAIIVFAPFLDTMLRGVIKHLVPPMQGEGEVAEAAYLRTRLSYARIGRVLLLAVLFFTIAKLWGIDFQNIAALGFGAQLAAKLMSFIMVLVLGYLVWEVVNLWLTRQLTRDKPADEGEPKAGDEGGHTAGTRIATILPLVRISLLIAISVITGLLALSQLGLNITPLLAGAGVFGIAIGFGAQTLVKDVVSGVFFLLDDAFRIGEFIDVGGTMGTIEKISVRSLRLRHPNGPVHIIPYGEIAKLTNNSRDYVIMKLRFTVPFDTDIEKVRKLFKKIGQQMMEDPNLAKDFIEPFKSQGVADVDDVGIVVRGKFMTKPGAQWVIRKEVYARVQKAFEENGIQFARKEVRVHIPDLDEDDELTKEQKEEVLKAAGTAAAAEAEKPGSSKPAAADPF
ncbi:MAG: mechanosensitive ion channel domain-containing protein [Pseudomonadota bacterium]